MPRKLTARMTLDVFEDEVLFTRAMLKAEPDGLDLLPLSDDWLAQVDACRASDRAARNAVAETDALRTVANARLDAACEKFGDELFLAVAKNRAAPRWKQFFGGPVSLFVRQRLDTQVQKVRAWLASTDDVLAKHKTPLESWSKAANEALLQSAGVALVRGQAATTREQLAEDLTRERDGLAEALAALARDKNLGRDWPGLFFRVESRSPAEEAAPPPPAPTPG